MKCQVCSTPLQYESCIDYEYPEEATGEEHTPGRCASTRLTPAEREVLQALVRAEDEDNDGVVAIRARRAMPIIARLLGES